MVSNTEQLHSPPSSNKRPRGILKNSQSYQNVPAESALASPPLDDDEPMTISPRRPSGPNRELSEKEITQMNTEINAGGPLGRRNSSNPRGSTSRRQSSVDQEYQDKTGSPRLQWDEANLYLNEGQMGGKMKIDEPKTPFVHGQDNPMDEDDDEEPATIDPDHIVVDELDKAKVLEGEAPTSQQKRPRENEIPDLDLGEPEQDVVMERRASDGEKKVIVAPADPDAMDIEDTGRHGEGREEDMPADEVAKHKKFEEMRKRHYEMSNVKGMLGHSEESLEEDE